MIKRFKVWKLHIIDIKTESINRNAPVEMFLGLVVSAVVGYSAIRLTFCLVRTHRVTPSLALSTAFRVVAFLYLVREMANGPRHSFLLSFLGLLFTML